MDVAPGAGACYICFDVTKEYSPCACKANVHKKCLYTWVHHSKVMHCTICRVPLQLPFFSCLSFMHATLQALSTLWVLCMLTYIGSKHKVDVPSQQQLQETSVSLIGYIIIWKCLIVFVQQHFIIRRFV